MSGKRRQFPSPGGTLYPALNASGRRDRKAAMEAGSPSRMRFRGMLSSSSGEEDADQKDTLSPEGKASLSRQTMRTSMSPTQSPPSNRKLATTPSRVTPSRSAVRTPLSSTAPERTTPARGLPPRDPITGKRLWPKFGGYAAIVVPTAAAEEEGASSSASSGVSATNESQKLRDGGLPHDSVEEARLERFRARTFFPLLRSMRRGLMPRPRLRSIGG